MLKVWRGKGKFFAECTECGSFGTAPHLQPRTKMSPEIASAVERHTAHMMALRSHFQKAAQDILGKARTHELTRDGANEKLREVWNGHMAQIQAAVAVLPSPDGQVQELVDKCPWCDHVEEVELVDLPEDVDAPEFELAKAITAYHAKNPAKEG